MPRIPRPGREGAREEGRGSGSEGGMGEGPKERDRGRREGWGESDLWGPERSGRSLRERARINPLGQSKGDSEERLGRRKTQFKDRKGRPGRETRSLTLASESPFSISDSDACSDRAKRRARGAQETAVAARRASAVRWSDSPGPGAGRAAAGSQRRARRSPGLPWRTLSR